ncbi:MAG: hypothetical protein P1U56_26795 [Saprospiraceae bacterium]|nr:hypothetical protein [Saprospiraceae bacterium]
MNNTQDTPSIYMDEFHKQKNGLKIFGMSTDGKIVRELLPADDSWPDFTYTRDRYNITKVATAMVMGKLWVFAISSNGNIYRNIRSIDGSWSNWKTIPMVENIQSVCVTCCCTVYGVPKVWLYYLDTNKAIWGQEFNSDGGSLNLKKLMVTDYVDISCSAYFQHIRFCGKGPTGNIKYHSWDISATGTGGLDINSQFYDWVHAKAQSMAISEGNNRVYVVKTTDGQIDYNVWNEAGVPRIDEFKKAGEVGYFEAVSSSHVDNIWHIFGATSEGSVWWTARDLNKNWRKFINTNVVPQTRNSRLLLAPFAAMSGPSLPEKIKSACLSLDEKSVYFFIEDSIVVYDIAKKRVIHEPQLVKDHFSSWPDIFSSDKKIRVSYRKAHSYSNPSAIPYHIISVIENNPADNSFYVVLGETKVSDPHKGEFTKFVFNGINVHVDKPYHMIADGPSFSLDIMGDRYAFCKPNTVPTYHSYRGNSISDALIKEVCSTLILPDGSTYIFVGGQAFHYKNYKGESQDLRMIPPKYRNPEHNDSTSISHIFKGVPLKHHQYKEKRIHDASRKKSAKIAFHKYKDDVDALRAKVTGADVLNLLSDDHARTRSTMSSTQERALHIRKTTPIFASISDYGKEEGFDIFWVGFHAQASALLTLGSTIGIAVDLHAFHNGEISLRLFKAPMIGIGAEAGAEATIMLGLHKGGFDEFFGAEWAIGLSAEDVIGIMGTVEFSGLEIAGVSIGRGIGLENGVSAELMYRYEPWLVKLYREYIRRHFHKFDRPNG